MCIRVYKFKKILPVSQNLSQICTTSAKVYRKSVQIQIQYRIAVQFETLSKWDKNMFVVFIRQVDNL